MVGAPIILAGMDFGAWHDGGVRRPCVREFLGWGSSDEKSGARYQARSGTEEILFERGARGHVHAPCYGLRRLMRCHLPTMHAVIFWALS
jgi:hypothetical protein